MELGFQRVLSLHQLSQGKPLNQRALLLPLPLLWVLLPLFQPLPLRDQLNLQWDQLLVLEEMLRALLGQQGKQLVLLMDMLMPVGILKPLLLVQDMDMGIELLMLMLLPVAIQLALKLLSRLCKLLWIVSEVRPNPTRVYVYTLGGNSQWYWMVLLVWWPLWYIGFSRDSLAERAQRQENHVFFRSCA